MTIVSIGEILWDVFEDSEKLGGAPFNFAVHARRLGHEVIFISAVGDDERGRKARAQAAELGLPTDFIQTVPGLPTGAVSVQLSAGGQPSFTIHRPAAYDAVKLDETTLARVVERHPEWISFGTLHQANSGARAVTRKLIDALPEASRFYDINLRRNSYTPALVSELMALAGVVKMNDSEAVEIDLMFGRAPEDLEEFTDYWSRRSKWRAVAVTRGDQGCAVRIGEDYAEAPGYRVEVADTVGAGDAFATGFLHGLSEGWDARRTGDFANRLGAVVAARPGGVPEWTLEDCRKL